MHVQYNGLSINIVKLSFNNRLVSDLACSSWRSLMAGKTVTFLYLCYDLLGFNMMSTELAVLSMT